MKKSIWYDGISLPEFQALDGDSATDTVIVGGGIAGLLCAYFLHKRGVPYILIEKDKICGGTTGNTTAKITYQHGLLYHKLMKKEGEECARIP